MGNLCNKRETFTALQEQEEEPSTSDVDQQREVVSRVEVQQHHSRPPKSLDHESGLPSSIHVTTDFPFLKDPATVNYIRQSRTLFLMRGVSGSGKTYLVKLLQQTYPTAKVCSADHFFIGEDGVYRYDKTDLSKAHEACQQAAKQFCAEDTPVVIVDNTNIQRWSMGFYVNLANNRYNYHVVVVEPVTPWKEDAPTLAEKNAHGVTEEIIRAKIALLKKEVYTPLFYAWFLNQRDSRALLDKGFSFFADCLALFPEMASEFSADCSFDAGCEPHFERKENKILHCTAKFNDRGDKGYYSNQEIVKKSLGKYFPVTIRGFVVTPETLGARVKLNASQLRLFEKEEEDSFEGQGDMFSKGFSAHVTIATARGVQAKQTGNDVIDICLRKSRGQIERTVEKDFGTFIYFGDGTVELSLKADIVVGGLYNGYYRKYG